MKAETWVSSSALLNRMNFALALTSGKVRGVKIDAVQLSGGPPLPQDASAILSAMEEKLLAADVSKQTHDSIVSQMMPQKTGEQPRSADQKSKSAQLRPPDANTVAGLLLGSPEFQRR
jgi:signal recognition particle GTPase